MEMREVGDDIEQILQMVYSNHDAEEYGTIVTRGTYGYVTK